MELPKSEAGDFEICPAGTHFARCYRFLDLGSHEQMYQGESKGLKRLVLVGWELPNELMKDGRPFSVNKRYTWSTHEKSNMRKDLESWRGRRFQDSDFGPGGFNVKNLIGVAATLGVTHSEKDGSTYNNVTSISPLPKGIDLPVLINAPVYLTLEAHAFDREVFEGLSEKLRQSITESPEYQAIFAPKKNSYAEVSHQRPLEPAGQREFAPVNEEDLEEVPF